MTAARRIRRTLLVLCLAAPITGCAVVVIGGIAGMVGVAKADKRKQTPGAAGEEVNAVLRLRTVNGELLAAADSGMLMVSKGRLVFVLADSILFIDALTRSAHWTGIELRTANRAAIQLTARYPQGVEPSLLQSLLAAYKQDRPDVVIR